MSESLNQYAQILRTRWRWLAWGAVVALILVAAALLFWPPRYRTEAMVFIRTPGDISQVVDGGDTYARTRAGTYAALARTNAVASRVIADTGLDLSPQKFVSRVQVSPLGGTALLRVRITGPSPDETTRTAQALVTELSAEVGTLEAVPGGLTPRAELVVVDPPTPPTRIVAWGAPLYPFVIGPIVLGALLGALGAVISAGRSTTKATAMPLTNENPEEPSRSNVPEAL
jgi:capsular polysaccharide biosynthesis protein